MGLRKKLHQAWKTNYALANGTYYRAPRLVKKPNGTIALEKPREPNVGRGMTDAAARLARHRKEQAARLADAPEPAITRQQLRAAHRRAA